MDYYHFYELLSCWLPLLACSVEGLSLADDVSDSVGTELDSAAVEAASASLTVMVTFTLSGVAVNDSFGSGMVMVCVLFSVTPVQREALFFGEFTDQQVGTNICPY